MCQRQARGCSGQSNREHGGRMRWKAPAWQAHLDVPFAMIERCSNVLLAATFQETCQSGQSGRPVQARKSKATLLLRCVASHSAPDALGGEIARRAITAA